MLPDLFLLFLFLVERSFLSFFFKPTSSPCIGESLLVIEDGFVVDVLESGDLGNEGFSVVGDFLVETVVLHVHDAQVGHFLQDFGDDVLAVDLVVRNVEGGDAGALKKAYEIGQTIGSDSVSLDLESGEFGKCLEPSNLFDEIVTEVEIDQINQHIEPTDFPDEILLQIQAPQGFQFFQILDLLDGISLQIDNLEPCELLQVIDFFEAFIVEVEDVVEGGGGVVLAEVGSAELFEKVLGDDAGVLGVGFEVHCYCGV